MTRISQQLTPDQLQLIRIYNPFDILTKKNFLNSKRKNPVLAAYADIPGAVDGPTKYGRESVSESFAESFALYHLGPMLKRIFDSNVSVLSNAAACGVLASSLLTFGAFPLQTIDPYALTVLKKEYRDC